MTSRIATVQAEARPGDVAHNVHRAAQLTAQAAAARASVVVFPEAFPTGYDTAVFVRPLPDLDDTAWLARTSEPYWNMIGPFGGLVAALMFKSAYAHPQREGEPAALTVNFCAAVARGARAPHYQAGRQRWRWYLLAFATALILAIALTAWPPYARLARAETMTVRGSDFVAAYRLTGASAWRIIARHIAPLCVPSLIVRITLDMSSIIITAASLGFLGMGAQPPSPEWGAMIATAKRFIFEQWWVATIPGIAIFLVSLAFNFLGDGLRDVLDPKGH